MVDVSEVVSYDFPIRGLPNLPSQSRAFPGFGEPKFLVSGLFNAPLFGRLFATTHYVTAGMPNATSVLRRALPIGQRFS
jgi:hypothetical protein